MPPNLSFQPMAYGCGWTQTLGNKQERPYIIDQALLVVPQNAIEIEHCLRITNGKPALAHWIGDVETMVG